MSASDLKRKRHPATVDKPYLLVHNVSPHARATPSPEISKAIPRSRPEVLGNKRDVLVYLPPGYRRSRTRRYPVLYLQDGQNVFDAATAFGGTEWGADETAQRLVKQKLIEPADHRRGREYR